MFAVACFALALAPSPVVTLNVFDPAQLTPLFDELLDTRVDFAAGRDLSAWRRDEFGSAALVRFDGLTGPTPPIVVVLPMTAADFRAKALTAAERASIPEAGARFTDSSGTTWHFAAAGDSVILSPDARLLDAPSPRATPEPFDCVSLHVNMSRVRQLAGREITATTQLVTLMLRGGASWLKGFDARQRESAAKLVGAAYRVIADGDEMSLSLKPSRDGASLTADWSCRPGTPSAKLLADEKPTELTEWQKLPLRVGDAPAYPIAVRKLSPAVARALAGVNPEFAAAPGDAASAKAIADYKERLARAGLVTEVRGGVSLPDPDGELGKSYEAALYSLRKGAAYRNLALRSTPIHYGGPGVVPAAQIPLDFAAATGDIADPNLRQAAFGSIEKLMSREPVISFLTSRRQFVRVCLSPSQANRTGPTIAALLGLGTQKFAAGNAELVTARDMLPTQLSAFVGLDMAESLKLATEFATTIETAMPAFPGWEMPTIDARVLKRSEAPFAAAAKLSPRGVTLSVGLPTRAVRMVWEAIEK